MYYILECLKDKHLKWHSIISKICAVYNKIHICYSKTTFLYNTVQLHIHINIYNIHIYDMIQRMYCFHNSAPPNIFVPPRSNNSDYKCGPFIILLHLYCGHICIIHLFLLINLNLLRFELYPVQLGFSQIYICMASTFSVKSFVKMHL